MVIKEGDKVVYEWVGKRKYIEVKAIEDTKATDWSIVTLINGIYSITWPLREPTELELEVKNFIW